MTLTRNKALYRQLLQIALPLALQNIITVGVSMTDTIMLGQLGETPISASSLANQPYFIFFLMMCGLSGGSIVLTSQYWGKQDVASISRVAGIALRFSVLLAGIVVLLCQLFPIQIMGFYTSEPEVAAQGAVYLRIVSCSYLFSAVSFVYLCIMRSVERVKISLISSAASFAVNVGLNALLIFGAGSIPPLGIKGAAIATLSARAAEFCIVMGYAAVQNRRWFHFKFSYLFRSERGLMSDFFRYSIPVILSETLWGSGISMQAAIIGNLGNSASAAANIVGVVQKLTTVLIIGVCDATTVIIGKLIGAGKEEKAKEAAFTLMRLSILMGAFSGGLVLLIGNGAMSAGIFSMLDKTAEYVHIMLYGAAAFVFFQSLNATVIVGILRGGGDTRAALLMDSLTMWFLSLPLGLLAGYVLHIPAPYVQIMMYLDEFVKYFFCIWRVKSMKWLTNVTR